MVALRKQEPQRADGRAATGRPVVIGTMMLALDEVDGLVSGLMHSTANTIRPACS
jgi:phosphate acetyltransferase